MSNLPPYPGGNNPYATNYSQPSSNNPYATNYNQPSTGGAPNQYATNYDGGSNYNPGSSTPSNQYATNYTPSGGSNYNQSNYNTPAPSYGTPAQGSNYGTSQPASRFGAQAADTNAYAGSGGGFHSYSKEETRSFVNYINEWVQNDPDLRGILPINPDSEDVFRAIGSTCLLCKLVNAIKPNTIDERKIHKGSVSVFQQTENLGLAIQGCKDMGVVVSHIGPQDLLDAKPHMILGLVWQVVKIGLLGKLNFDQHPELVVMLSPTEDVSTFMRLAPEVNLLRWFNWHLNRSGYPKNVNNFSNDIKDAQPYLALLEQIAPHVVPKGVHQEPDARTRAQYVCDYAKQLGCGGFLAPEDILQGNDKLNMAFTAYLFNKYPGLEGLQDSMSHQKLQEVESALHQRYQEEDKLRSQRWDQEEADRRRNWEDQEMQRRRQLEAEEVSRREQLAREEAEMRARLGAEAAAQEARMRQWQLQQQAEEQARKYEGERQAREFEEQRRRHEQEQERLRLEAAEKQRAWEAEQRLQQAKKEEEERRRREEEQRRMAEEKRRQEEERRRAEEEEARRRQYEEQKRYEEEQRRKALAEEEARRKAWDEYYATQAANAAAQAAMEEEKRRRSAWDEYNKQQEAARQEAARQAAAEEARRQAAWAQYQQEQAAAAAAAQQQAMMTMQIQQQQAAAAQQAMMTMQAQQAAMMATRTVVVQPPPTVQKTTTVTKVVTTPAKPAKWPIPRLIVTVVRGNRLIKSDLFGKSDPYVKLVHNGNAQKTTWLKNTVDPVYNQDFEFRNVAQSDIILVQVWDHDTLGKDNFMGELKLTSGDFVDGDQSAFELRSRDFRADRVHGDLVLKFRLIYP